MSEAIAFFTKNDFINLAGFILNTYNAVFIPETNFKSAKSIGLKSVPEILNHLQLYPEKAPALSYHIISPFWSVEPIYFHQVCNETMGSYYSAHQRYGGPSIEITPRMFGLPSSFTDRIISGSIADYAYYISGSFLQDTENGYKTIDRPDALKMAFSEIVRFIKQHGNRVVYRNGMTRVAHAMTEASELYDKGIKLMQGEMIFEKE
jgi:hypothetical protein